jgi:hypothetical protein
VNLAQRNAWLEIAAPKRKNRHPRKTTTRQQSTVGLKADTWSFYISIQICFESLVVPGGGVDPFVRLFILSSIDRLT